MTLLDGKKLSNEIQEEIGLEVQKMKENGEKVPHLAAIIVGSDGASLTYVNVKYRHVKGLGLNLRNTECLPPPVS